VDWESALDSVWALYWGLGPFFSVVFVALVGWALYIWLGVSRDCSLLDFSDETLRRVKAALEDNDSQLWSWVRSGMRAAANPRSIDVEIDAVLDPLLSADRNGAGALRSYLRDLMRSPRADLGDDDARIDLSRIRNLLRAPYARAAFLGSTLSGVTISFGLFGTISGMYRVFGSLQVEDSAKLIQGMGSMMSSLSQAMFTTGVALILSISMILSIQGFLIRLRSIEGRMHEIESGVRSVRRSRIEARSSDGSR
jgi:hypothetical protein